MWMSQNYLEVFKPTEHAVLSLTIAGIVVTACAVAV